MTGLFDFRVCDPSHAAAVHSCSIYSKVRDRFEKDTNSLLIHGGCGTQGSDDDRLSIPGGWGACGAPNDAWHQWYHYLRRAYSVHRNVRFNQDQESVGRHGNLNRWKYKNFEALPALCNILYSVACFVCSFCSFLLHIDYGIIKPKYMIKNKTGPSSIWI